MKVSNNVLNIEPHEVQPPSGDPMHYVWNAIQSSWNTLVRKLERIEDAACETPQEDTHQQITEIMKRLHSVELIGEEEFYRFQQAMELDSDRGIERPGRERCYSIDVHAGIDDNNYTATYSFDVKATNAFDAYVQLSKRSSYRFIHDVRLVRVFDGLLTSRRSEFPIRSFSSGELIFV